MVPTSWNLFSVIVVKNVQGPEEDERAIEKGRKISTGNLRAEQYLIRYTFSQDLTDDISRDLQVKDEVELLHPRYFS